MDMIIILVGLALLLVLTLKKVPVVYAAAISVIFIALFSRLPVVSTMTGDYMTGFANFVKSSWLMLLLGAILSKVMDITGAARSIASFIIGKLGVKFAIPAISNRWWTFNLWWCICHGFMFCPLSNHTCGIQGS